MNLRREARHELNRAIVVAVIIIAALAWGIYGK